MTGFVQIAKVRKERRERDGVEIVLSGSDDEDTDESLSDDELIADDIKVRIAEEESFAGIVNFVFSSIL